MNTEPAELLVTDIDCLLTLNPPWGEGPLGRVEHAAVGFRAGRVSYLGPAESAPPALEVRAVRGAIALPGLVDCHTHSLFAGSRADEFRRKLAGESYTSILEAGGGILSTVQATRAAPDEALAALLHERLEDMLSRGVTTVEVKTGYALDEEHELRHLRLLRGRRWATRVVPTFLGAHAIPSEFRADRAAYVRLLLDRVLPQAAELAEAVDVYCDRGAFTLAETRQLLERGLGLGLSGRVHAEQVEHTGAAALAGELGLCSADHLERVDAAGVAAMARGGTTAVLLPAAMLYLRDVSPPVGLLRAAGVPMAIATDFNPGSSPARDLWACATLACLTMGLTVEEALLGITRHAGMALGRPDLGRLFLGGPGDLAVMFPPPGEPPDPAVLVQYLGGHAAALVVRDGAVELG